MRGARPVLATLLVLALAGAAACAGASADPSASPATSPSRGPSESGPPVEVVVLADSAFAPVFRRLAPAYEASRPGVRLVLGYDATALLRERIESGAPADAFVALGGEAVGALAAARRTEGPAIPFAASPTGPPCVAVAVVGGEHPAEGAAFVAWLGEATAAGILRTDGFTPAP